MPRTQIESYDVPPAVAEAYKTAATATGMEGVSPVYMGAGAAIVASTVLLLTWGRCSGSKPNKASSDRGSKKSKAKPKSASPTANGRTHKNGDSGKDGGAEAPPAVVKAKPTKKTAKAPPPQPKGKGKRKSVPEAPPVITVRRGG